MKTLLRLSEHFYWPKIFHEVKAYCKTCRLTTGKARADGPLMPLPIIDTPFEHIGVDVLGPVERGQT